MGTAMEQEVTCPKCGGDTWDNRATKKNPKAPDYRCRDKSCDGVVWPPKPNGAARPAAAPARPARQELSIGHVPGLDNDHAPQAPTPAPRAVVTFDTLLTNYRECLRAVKPILAAEVEPVSPLTAENILAAAATLFIERNKRGL
jgi:hypothetical protein